MQFEDLETKELDLCDEFQFYEFFVECLCGRLYDSPEEFEVEEESDSEELELEDDIDLRPRLAYTGALLRKQEWDSIKEIMESLKEQENMLSRKTMEIGVEQLNEILLLLNQDRVSKGFFDFFFEKNIERISELKMGVAKFRGYSLLRFGNIRFSFNRLRTMNTDQIMNELGQNGTGENILDYKKLKARPSEVLVIDEIEKNLTLFSGEVPVIKLRTEKAFLEEVYLQMKSGIPSLDGIIAVLENEKKDSESMESLHNEFRASKINKCISDMVRFFNALYDSYPSEDDLRSEVKSLIDEYTEISQEQVDKTIAMAQRNTDVYLTWDFMDVYIATSMRNGWEFEECADFIETLSRTSNLKDIWGFLRVFNPTQSKCFNRIDKGLVEQLMLKRVRCTIYMAQEIDTMGKDSELAATLAQGKPVIAFIPDRVDYISMRDRPTDFHWQRFLSHMSSEILYETDFDNYLEKEELNRKNVQDAISFLHSRLSNHLKNRILTFSEKTRKIDEKFQNQNKEQYENFVRVLSAAQEFHYDKRMKTLQYYHPLALQVDLATGVANGVLIVRSIEKCANLLKAILEDKLEFTIDRYVFPGTTEKSETLVLIESITNCIYRVQTDYERLSNSFWNLYFGKN